jgi:aryl-alcohol dehydrogenase-like predicted oxidoreductase
MVIAQRALGGTGRTVSALGLGTWAMGGDEWGASDDQQSLDVLRAAISEGVTLFDTADVYGFGHSEELVGEAVRPKDDALIVSKVGWDIYTEPRVVGGSRRVYERDYIESAFAESCRRLARSTIDIYLLHNPSAAEVAESEGLSTLRDIQARGGAKWIGASVGSEEDARAVIEAGVDVVELPLNVVRNWACGILPLARKHGTAVLAREPLERGLLTGKYATGQQFPEGDHRNDKGADWLNAGLEHAERVRQVAEQLDRSMSATAIGYPLSYSEVASTLCGARSVEQLRANVAAVGTTLSAEQRSFLEAGRVDATTDGAAR